MVVKRSDDGKRIISKERQILLDKFHRKKKRRNVNRFIYIRRSKNAQHQCRSYHGCFSKVIDIIN